MQLTLNFSLTEFTASKTAMTNNVDNTLPKSLEKNARLTAEGLERVRKIIRKAIYITSGYRSPILNSLVGGESDSQHLFAQAADIVAPGYGSPAYLAHTIYDHRDVIRYDQLILEKNKDGVEWVHISFKEKPRIESLKISPGEAYALQDGLPETPKL